MNERIYCISYYDYTHRIGRLEALREFASLQMTYYGRALSTPEVHVNVSPNEFKIDADKTDTLREYAIPYLDKLIETSEVLAKNSPQYICIQYYSGEIKYYKYHAEFCKVFNIAWKMDPKESVEYKTRQYYENEFNRVDVEALKTSTRQSSPVSPINTYFPTQPYSPPSSIQKRASKSEDSIPWGKIIIGLILIIGVIAVMLSSAVDLDDLIDDKAPTQTKSAIVPVIEPQSGAILSGTEAQGEAELTINASNDAACVVKLKTKAGITKLSFYVRAGDTVTVGVPKEQFYAYFASGENWYGINTLFGSNTIYSMDDEILDFGEGSWQYTLYPVSNGNFTQTPIDAEDF